MTSEPTRAGAVVDLRSDTVTRPTASMREAMMAAELGDDVFGDDPTVNALQDALADMLGFEAALFMASGTQSNLCGLMSHCQRGDEYIVGQMAHTYRWEGGGAAVLGSIQPQPLNHAPDGSLPLADIEANIKPDDAHFARTRLLTLENTIGGKVLPMDYLADATALAKRRGLTLLLDETYKDFLPEGTRPHELFGDPDWRGTLVHLYSFSKVFALTGYRVGAVTAGAKLMAEIEKAMDCVSICPPRLGQEAALYGLRNLLPWARENTKGLKARADLLGNGLNRSNRWRLISIGAYFAYVEHPFGSERSTRVSKRLADEENLRTIPGDMFGAGQERFIRLAFANVSDDKIPIVLERLERFGA